MPGEIEPQRRPHREKRLLVAFLYFSRLVVGVPVMRACPFSILHLTLEFSQSKLTMSSSMALCDLWLFYL